MRINAAKAIEKLGINHPVRFVATDFAGTPTAEAGVSPLDPSTILVNPARCARHGARKIAEILAHELVHVRQMQEIGNPSMAAWVYERELEENGYKGNRFEREANELAPLFAPFIEVTA